MQQMRIWSSQSSVALRRTSGVGCCEWRSISYAEIVILVIRGSARMIEPSLVVYYPNTISTANEELS